MAVNSALKQYQQNSVTTATPAELTLMLYKGLVKFLKFTLAELENHNFQGVNTNLIKAQDIVRELLCTLNMRIELSKDLAAMYEYMIERMIEANVKKDPVIVEEILSYAEEFRDTWAEAMKLAK
jgi:flagellar protein FliS